VDLGYSPGFHVYGDFGSDFVTLGGLVTRGTFAVGTEFREASTMDLKDGIFGLSKHATSGQTLIESILGSLAQPLFTMDLRGPSIDLGLGYIDGNFQNKIDYVPVQDVFVWWAFQTAGYQIGSNTRKDTKWTTILGMVFHSRTLHPLESI
jgi:hypothetical protein